VYKYFMLSTNSSTRGHAKHFGRLKANTDARGSANQAGNHRSIDSFVGHGTQRFTAAQICTARLVVNAQQLSFPTPGQMVDYSQVHHVWRGNGWKLRSKQQVS
jgi:hypothetical protein